MFSKTVPQLKFSMHNNIKVHVCVCVCAFQINTLWYMFLPEIKVWSLTPGRLLAFRRTQSSSSSWSCPMLHTASKSQCKVKSSVRIVSVTLPSKHILHIDTNILAIDWLNSFEIVSEHQYTLWFVFNIEWILGLLYKYMLMYLRVNYNIKCSPTLNPMPSVPYSIFTSFSVSNRL